MKSSRSNKFSKKNFTKVDTLNSPKWYKNHYNDPLIDESYCWLWCIFCCFTLWQWWGTKNWKFISIRGIPPQSQKKSQNSQKMKKTPLLIVLKNLLYTIVKGVSRCHFNFSDINFFQKFHDFFAKLYHLGKLRV